MSDTYDRLPPDQRAVLSLVLERGKSYAEVAAMLSIPETTVRERARAALDSLAAEGVALHGSTAAAPRAQPGPSESRAPIRPARASRGTPSSRTGGALLLGGILVVIVVAVVLITGGGGGKGGGATTSTKTTGTNASTSTSTSSRARPRIDKKLTLSPVEPESRAGGEAYVLSDGSRHAFYVAAQHLPPSQGFFYAVWLYNSPSSSAPLGRAPAVSSSGRLEGGGPLPSNAADYGKILITRETSTHARHPGTTVLSGDFSLH
ncbi:MAG TPA: sigma factor-like helix-turn-helix DNA-binding protein [Solirubrobacteraceae bacterium]|nr:sigma factor-like helix-turn-helix DNA-binding protein [Solirubrobacteraceae bacterium]